jgi:hypothetical protein
LANAGGGGGVWGAIVGTLSSQTDLVAALATKAPAASPTFTGIVTSAGANVTPAAAMSALAIDVTKSLNTKSITADSTLTFSGTPAAANTWFSVHVINTDTTAAHTITFPSAFIQVTQAARTSCPIAISGELFLNFRYDGSGYKVFGDGDYINKFDATAAPAVTDDISKGFGPGSSWYDATGNVYYVCESNSVGAAVWTSLIGVTLSGAVALTTSTVTDATKYPASESGASNFVTQKVLANLLGKVVSVQVTDLVNAITTGDGKALYRIPALFNGWNLSGVAMCVDTASSSGIPTFQLRRKRSGSDVDMLSTALTVDASETDSSTAATPAVIDTNNDDVNTADRIYFDCDVAGTGTKGVLIEMTFQKP